MKRDSGKNSSSVHYSGLFAKDSSDFLIYSLHFMKLRIKKILRLNYLDSYGFCFPRKIPHHIKFNIVKSGWLSSEK